MPIVAWLVLAYLSGLLAGFAGVGLAAAIFIGAGGLTAIVADRPRIAALLLIGAAGIYTADDAVRSRRECVRVAGRARTIRVRVTADAGPGGFTRGVSVSCAAPLTLFVARGRVLAGSEATAAGAIEAASDSLSLVVRAATVSNASAQPWAARLRSAAGRGIDSAFRVDAPLVRALVIADMQGMPPAVRDEWSEAGMVHMLSVSGLHVGIIASVVALLLGVLRVDRARAPVIAVTIISLYVVVIGAPAPAVRAAAMLALVALGKHLQRAVSPWAIVALGAIQPAFTPWTVLDLGYQLSVIGVAALVVAGRLVKRLRIPARPRWRKEVASAVVCTVVASIASAPLVAYAFGRVSVIAPVSNLVAGPFVAAVQPILFLGVILSPLGDIARFVGDAAHPLLAAMNGIAAASAAVPGASLTVWPTTPMACAAAAITLGILVACVHPQPLRPLLIAALAIALLAHLPPPRGGALTEIHMIDVGQGDAVAVRTRAGRWILFDAGRVWSSGDAGKRTIIPYIAHRGGTLHSFILSHPHADHVGGATSVLEDLRPLRYVDAGFVTPSGVYAASLRKARERGIAWSRVIPGSSITVDEVRITFLAPDSAFAASLPDPNNASTVALVQVGSVTALLMGDAEREEEEWLLQHARPFLDADVLKLGHHGSSTSSTPEFLDAVTPTIALVSVGAGNTYRHPSPEIMKSLSERGAQVLRTDQLGTVVLETDGTVIRRRERP